MALTLGGGPLSSRPRAAVNYRIDGPAHRLLFEPFPRRVRAVFGGETVALPAPRRRPGQSAHSYRPPHTLPVQGDASYWPVAVNGQAADNALWSYLDPLPDAGWLRNHVALYWSSMDAWFDEDEEVAGHLRNPYHRVDVRPTSRHVRVMTGDDVIAESYRSPRAPSGLIIDAAWLDGTRTQRYSEGTAACRPHPVGSCENFSPQQLHSSSTAALTPHSAILR